MKHRHSHRAAALVVVLTAAALTLATASALASVATAWGHNEDKTDGRNFNAVLRPAPGGPEEGSGKVRFRQPKDEHKIVYLTVGLRRLVASNAYYLERATDAEVNGNCTAATNWLRLGAGLVPSAIATDNTAKGRALLFRDLAMVAEGTRLDIHFQVVDATTNAVVLVSDCHQFTVKQ